MEEELKLKKKRLILAGILFAIAAAAIAIAAVMMVKNNAIFADLNNYADQVEEGMMTVEEFNELYTPLKTKSNVHTVLGIILLLGGVGSLVYSFIFLFKALIKKKREE